MLGKGICSQPICICFSVLEAEKWGKKYTCSHAIGDVVVMRFVSAAYAWGKLKSIGDSPRARGINLIL